MNKVSWKRVPAPYLLRGAPGLPEEFGERAVSGGAPDARAVRHACTGCSLPTKGEAGRGRSTRSPGHGR